MIRILSKALIMFVLMLIVGGLLGGCTATESEQANQEQQLEAVFNQVAVYTVDLTQNCDDGHGIIRTTHTCTDFWLEGSEFVCKGEGYPNGVKRLSPEDGCYFYEPLVQTGY